MWQGFWDFVFVFANFLLAILFGAAAGNVARGVPLDAHGDFAMPFFTNFGVHRYVGLLDWYTVSVAVLAVVVLAAHGATYLVLKTEGPVHDRSEAYAKALWVAAGPLFLGVSFASWLVRPVLVRAVANPLCWLGSLVVLAALALLASGLATRHERRAFVGSNLLIGGVLATGGAAMFPVMLYSTLAPENSLTAYGVASSRSALVLASLWWPAGLALATAYFVFISRRYAGKVSVERDNQGFY
jgi:cytochrome d ubiquinol oxidase subunit II